MFVVARDIRAENFLRNRFLIVIGVCANAITESHQNKSSNKAHSPEIALPLSTCRIYSHGRSLHRAELVWMRAKPSQRSHGGPRQLSIGCRRAIAANHGAHDQSGAMPAPEFAKPTASPRISLTRARPRTKNSRSGLSVGTTVRSRGSAETPLRHVQRSRLVPSDGMDDSARLRGGGRPAAGPRRGM